MSINEDISQNLNITQSIKNRYNKRTSIYNIVRWLFASISKHFDSLKGDIPFYVEGQQHAKEESSVELRLNGPFINHPIKNYWKIDLDVNLLITSTIDDQDLHNIYRLIDKFLLGFTELIEIYKYGDTIDDDQSLLGCLVMRTDIQDAVIVSNFGQIEPTLRIMQSTVNAIYSMELD